MRIQKSLLIPRLHYIHDSKTKNTFYWKTTLLTTRQFHRHYLGVGGSSGKMILKMHAIIISVMLGAKRLIQIAPSGDLEI